MPETREPRSVVDAAEQAAAAGDYASAEQLLRDAAHLQEASLGPRHPDLANTLNNLGVVCEIIDKPDHAERCFRRAWEIATTVLERDHPFVATSRKNLEDFCRARGRPVDPSIPPPAIAVDVAAPPARVNLSRRLAIGALISGGLIVAFIATPRWLRSNEGESSSARTPGLSPVSPTTSAGTRPGAPIPTRPRAAEKRAAEKRATAASVRPVVVAAHLCRDLSTGSRGSSADWQCAPPNLPVGPGPLFFYTRVTSPTDTTVQHRWYRGDRLRQVVELRIRANTTGGYRTYSRNTVNNQDRAAWRVELRTTDGILLHQARFSVR